MSSSKRQKTKRITLRTLPYRIVIEILKINIMLVPTTDIRHRYVRFGSHWSDYRDDYKEVPKYIPLTDFFGYFSKDHFRKVFPLVYHVEIQTKILQGDVFEYEVQRLGMTPIIKQHKHLPKNITIWAPDDENKITKGDIMLLRNHMDILIK